MKRERQSGKMNLKHKHENGLTDKIWEYIKTIVVILLLLAVTLVALEIPRGFYEHSDEQLMNQVIENSYSISVVKEPMNLSQKIEALREDDSIVAEKKEIPHTEETEQWVECMIDEIKVLLDYGWQDEMVHILEDDETDKTLHYIEIIQVKDDKIYSYDVGMLNFYNVSEYAMLAPGVILFDTETGKILYLETILDEYMQDVGYTDAIYDPSTFYEVTIDEDSYGVYNEDVETYITDAGNAALEEKVSEEKQDTGAKFTSFYETLTEYYGQPLDDDDYPFLSGYAVCVCPFSVDDVSGKTMTAIYDYSYKYYLKLY